VLKLPVRDPVLVAKQATSVAVLTGNRLVLGVGSSPWREDYEVPGVAWERTPSRWPRKSGSYGDMPKRSLPRSGADSARIPPAKLVVAPD
jgi:hypothetical protein